MWTFFISIVEKFHDYDCRKISSLCSILENCYDQLYGKFHDRLITSNYRLKDKSS